jgi:hypothetical protein
MPAHPDNDYPEKSSISLAVAASVEPMSLDFARGSRNGTDPTHFGSVAKSEGDGTVGKLCC